MSSQSPILLILGAGKNIGASVATLFRQKGYKIALAARNSDAKSTAEDGTLNIKADLSSPATVSSVFDTVESTFGRPASVVVYNAASSKFVPADDPFQLELEDVERDWNVNALSVFAAAKRAVQGFRRLAHEGRKGTFIYTGNFLNVNVKPAMWSMGAGKAAAAHMIQAAAMGYEKDRYRFYYADERKADGDAVYMGISGAAAAEHYYSLAESENTQGWLQTFVGGQGYTDFSSPK